MMMMMMMMMMMTERTEQLLVSNRQTTFDRQLDAAQLGRFGSQVNMLRWLSWWSWWSRWSRLWSWAWWSWSWTQRNSDSIEVRSIHYEHYSDDQNPWTSFLWKFRQLYLRSWFLPVPLLGFPSHDSAGVNFTMWNNIKIYHQRENIVGGFSSKDENNL